MTRFAPSPTGFLHIGGARTALFNYLFARANGGKFLLRIEDTDRERSTPEAVDAILDGMKWLGLDWDGEPIYQFARHARHAEVAWEMLRTGHAYKCFATPQELEEMREAQRAAGEPQRYDGRWRNRNESEAAPGAPFVVRLKAQEDGATTVDDLVQGEVTVQNSQLDDMVLLRSDGTPTYMLAVVVDDHDMGITHVIRGDDHLTNTFRQVQIYQAMQWDIPRFAHLPLIHGNDGHKLSKRHGAVNVNQYRDEGYLPAAMRNYLVRLGWGHGDQEIFSDAELLKLFDVKNVGRAPSRFDYDKLNSLNNHYMREADIADLKSLLKKPQNLDDAHWEQAIILYRERCKTLFELQNTIEGISIRPENISIQNESKPYLIEVSAKIKEAEQTPEKIDEAIKNYASERQVPFKLIGQPLRLALTGQPQGPSIGCIVEVIGLQEAIIRIETSAGS